MYARLSILAGEIGVGASFMTPWQPVDLRTGVMNDAPTPTTTIPLKDRDPYATRPFVVKNALTFGKGNAMGRESYVYRRLTPVLLGCVYSSSRRIMHSILYL
jgi:hypothetical protein